MQALDRSSSVGPQLQQAQVRIHINTLASLAWSSFIAKQKVNISNKDSGTQAPVSARDFMVLY